MRAIAACQFILSRFEAWRWAVALFTGCVVVGLTLWFTIRPVALPWWAAVALGIVGLASLALCESLLRTPAVSLRWDGQDWHLGLASSAGHEPTAGALSVALDLGDWMLLRFCAHEETHGRPKVPHPPRGADDVCRRPGGALKPCRGSRVTWLPVQRRGMEPHWHGLRCAVYSPRPALDAA